MPTKFHGLSVRLVAVFTLALWSAACASPRTSLAHGEPAVLIDREGLAIGGLDPVSYFVDGEPRAGKPSFKATHEGATYRFSSAENRETFLKDPGRFAPAYGGFCAWALADGDGSLVEVDPKSFLVQEGRLLLFYDGLLADTRALWLQGDEGELAQAADRNWKRILTSADE